ncbi:MULTISPECIES: hypothetical protein [Pseudomonas syringae group]|uniref:hypothetical protein n=1 Tax=Pseudomonas syringae group TaxID=136849 RepID=UPI0013DAB39F|nr:MULTISPECIES: hypothetical protein [Pseudomonas syringae group]
MANFTYLALEITVAFPSSAGCLAWQITVLGANNLELVGFSTALVGAASENVAVV